MHVRALAVATLTFLTVLSTNAFAQAPAPQDYLSQLEGVRPSALPDGRLVLSMDATAGDLRGMLTLTVAESGSGVTGTWVFTSTFIEDLRADGTPIPASDHVGHDHDDPNTPGVHREYARFRRDGALSGKVTGATLLWTADGAVAGVADAELVVEKGSRTFAGATGSGRVGPWQTMPGVLTLFLSF